MTKEYVQLLLECELQAGQAMQHFANSCYTAYHNLESALTSLSKTDEKKVLDFMVQEGMLAHGSTGPYMFQRHKDILDKKVEHHNKMRDLSTEALDALNNNKGDKDDSI